MFHSAHSTLSSRGVRFTAADKCVFLTAAFPTAATVTNCNNSVRYVVSIGGDDRALFQWRVVKDFANSDAF
jgi:hypothetical protein